jgi:predicted nucleic-acid-binding protein
MAKAIAIDANIVVRYLVGDDPSQTPEAADLFGAARAGKVTLVVPVSALVETVYVLERIYRLAAAAIAPKLLSLFAIPNVTSPDSRWLVEGLQMYRSKNSDFGDALLCAFADHHGCGVATFDKDLMRKFPEITAQTPAQWLAALTAS